MRPAGFKLDRASIEAWMKQELGDDIRRAAEDMAARIRAESGVEVTVQHLVTDRPHSVVMVHENGAAREAKHGHLARAATGLGLKVGPPRGYQLRQQGGGS